MSSPLRSTTSGTSGRTWAPDPAPTPRSERAGRGSYQDREVAFHRRRTGASGAIASGAIASGAIPSGAIDGVDVRELDDSL